MSQRDLAAASKVSTSSIVLFERGKVVLKHSTLAAIFEVFRERGVYFKIHEEGIAYGIYVLEDTLGELMVTRMAEEGDAKD